MKKTIPYHRYLKIIREADSIVDLLKMPGWKLLVAELEEQAANIEQLLAENRLRTVSEMITTPQGTQSFTTTAETQIAENAGMYKMIKHIFSTIEMIASGPDRLNKLEREGSVIIQKADTTAPVEATKPILSHGLKKQRTKLNKLSISKKE